MEQFGRKVAAEMEEFHINLWLAPGLNIHRNPLCGRNFEYYSEDPVVTGKMAAGYIKRCTKPGSGYLFKTFCRKQSGNKS